MGYRETVCTDYATWSSVALCSKGEHVFSCMSMYGICKTNPFLLLHGTGFLPKTCHRKLSAMAIYKFDLRSTGQS